MLAAIAAIVPLRNRGLAVSGGMRLVYCGGPIGAGPPEIDGGEPWPYGINILDCWFFGDRVYSLAVEGWAIPLFASESFSSVLAVLWTAQSSENMPPRG